MRTLALLAMLAVGCGASPEFAETPDGDAPAPTANESEASPAARSSAPHQQGQEWQCAGTTAATRQQGRMSRHQSIEGFASRGCIQPATNAELDPRH